MIMTQKFGPIGKLGGMAIVNHSRLGLIVASLFPLIACLILLVTGSYLSMSSIYKGKYLL